MSAEEFELKSGLRAVPESGVTDAQRHKQIKVKKGFRHSEHIKGEGLKNVVSGLELVENVLSKAEQSKLTDHIEQWLEKVNWGIALL